MNKKLLIIISILIVLGKDSYGKKPVGIFMTATDFQHNKIAYMQDASQGETTIRIHHFFWNMPTITIVTKGSRHNLRKSDLYGFIDSNKDVYRFYNNMEYRLAEAGNIYIYIHQNNIAQSKGFIVVNTYYFSSSADGKIERLTMDNLKTVYAGNEKFIDLLDQYNGNVSSYDKQNKTYKINYIFSKTSRQ
ncbi:MAG: hypothetical protein P4L41_04605 [Flavipsychrobacter sp.]|nr:hypothetical protein [Flavipsychrobacter sp.]